MGTKQWPEQDQFAQWALTLPFTLSTSCTRLSPTSSLLLAPSLTGSLACFSCPPICSLSLSLLPVCQLVCALPVWSVVITIVQRLQNAPAHGEQSETDFSVAHFSVTMTTGRSQDVHENERAQVLERHTQTLNFDTKLRRLSRGLAEPDEKVYGSKAFIKTFGWHFRSVTGAFEHRCLLRASRWASVGFLNG